MKRLAVILFAGITLALPAADPPGPYACLDPSLCGSGAPPHPPLAQ